MRLWDVETGVAVRELEAGHGPLRGLLFTRDGGRLVALSGAAELAAHLWDPARGELVGRWAIPLPVPAAGEPADEPVLVGAGEGGLVVGSRGRVRILDAASGATLAAVEEPSLRGPFALGPEGRLLAAGCEGRITRVWDLAAPSAPAILEGHSAPVSALAFEPAPPPGRTPRLATGSRDRTVRLWDLDTGLELALYHGHADPVEQLAFAAGGRLLLSHAPPTGAADERGATRVWSTLQDGRGQRLLGPGACAVPRRGASLVFDPAGTRLSAVIPGGPLRTWELATARALPGGPDVSAAAYHPEGYWRVQARARGPLEFVDPATGQSFEIDPGPRPVPCVAVSPDGTYVATGEGRRPGDAGHGYAVRVREVATGRLVWSFEGHPGEITHVAFGPAGARLATLCRAGRPRVWDLFTGSLTHELGVEPGSARSLAFSPRLLGAQIELATGGADGRVVVWNAVTGAPEHQLAGHGDEVVSLAFGEEGRRLISGSTDGTVRLWDAWKGEALLVLGSRGRPVAACAFSPDGRRVAALFEDGELRLWEGRPAAEVHAERWRAEALEEAERLLDELGPEQPGERPRVLAAVAELEPTLEPPGEDLRALVRELAEEARDR